MLFQLLHDKKLLRRPPTARYHTDSHIVFFQLKHIYTRNGHYTALGLRKSTQPLLQAYHPLQQITRLSRPTGEAPPPS